MSYESRNASNETAARQAALAQVETALDRRLVSPREVERFLAQAAAGRAGGASPTAAVVLYTVGAIVIFGGIALAYSTIFGDLPRALRLTTPVAFPLVALAASMGLRWHRSPAWQVELAGLVACVSVAGACVAIGRTSRWLVTDHDTALFAAAAAVIAALIAVGLWRVIRSARLLVLGLGAALAVLGISLAQLAGLLREGTWSWVFLTEAGAAAGVAILVGRRDTRACQYVSYWALAGVWASSIAGVSAAGPEHFSIWHVMLAAGVVLAFIAAAAMNFNGLLWLAALAGLQWLQAIAIVVGSATNAAFTVVLTGLGLCGLGLLVAKLNRRIRPSG
jgi:hypothetical protein